MATGSRFTAVKRAESAEKKHLSLLSSMLITFFSLLALSIALTLVVFSLAGRSVYERVVSGEMLSQAELLSEETVKVLNGEITPESFRFMLRSIDSKVVLLDAMTDPLNYGGIDQGKPGMVPEIGEGSGRLDENVEFCRALMGDITADPDSRFSMVVKDRGIVVATLIKDGESNVLGAVFLIKPINDISSTSTSLVIVLLITTIAVDGLVVLPLIFISRWLTNPVERLTKASAELAEGNYKKRVEPSGSREVRELGASYNMLAESLQENIGALTVERNRLKAVIDGLGEGIVGFDTSCGVTRINAAAEKLIGGREAIEGDPVVTEIIRSVLGSGEKRVEIIPSGERKIRLSSAPILEENGNTVGAVALLLDVTEAERLEQTRRDYVANVSHELRTPLASIRGIADMLNDGLVKSEDDKFRYYGYILKESIRLSTLINDLLELSRLQSGGVALKLRSTELYELLADVADRIREPAAERGMRVDLTVPEGRYLALSNPDRVEQVLIILTDNAVKHGTEGGTVTVGMDDGGDRWSVFVENPAEIEQKDLDHIFERFYKADIAHTSEGTGLGLAIAEEVLNLLGESISASYENGLIRFTFTVRKKL